MNLNIRKATRDDLVHIVRLLANDSLGSQRESYQITFAKLASKFRP